MSQRIEKIRALRWIRHIRNVQSQSSRSAAAKEAQALAEARSDFLLARKMSDEALSNWHEAAQGSARLDPLLVTSWAGEMNRRGIKLSEAEYDLRTALGIFDDARKDWRLSLAYLDLADEHLRVAERKEASRLEEKRLAEQAEQSGRSGAGL